MNMDGVEVCIEKLELQIKDIKHDKKNSLSDETLRKLHHMTTLLSWLDMEVHKS